MATATALLQRRTAPQWAASAPLGPPRVSGAAPGSSRFAPQPGRAGVVARSKNSAFGFEIEERDGEREDDMIRRYMDCVQGSNIVSELRARKKHERPRDVHKTKGRLRGERKRLERERPDIARATFTELANGSGELPTAFDDFYSWALPEELEADAAAEQAQMQKLLEEEEASEGQRRRGRRGSAVAPGEAQQRGANQEWTFVAGRRGTRDAARVPKWVAEGGAAPPLQPPKAAAIRPLLPEAPPASSSQEAALLMSEGFYMDDVVAIRGAAAASAQVTLARGSLLERPAKPAVRAGGSGRTAGTDSDAAKPAKPARAGGSGGRAAGTTDSDAAVVRWRQRRPAAEKQGATAGVIKLQEGVGAPGGARQPMSVLLPAVPLPGADQAPSASGPAAAAAAERKPGRVRRYRRAGTARQQEAANGGAAAAAGGLPAGTNMAGRRSGSDAPDGIPLDDLTRPQSQPAAGRSLQQSSPK